MAEYIRRLIRADLGQMPRTGDVRTVLDLGASGGSHVAPRRKDEDLGEVITAERTRG